MVPPTIAMTMSPLEPSELILIKLCGHSVWPNVEPPRGARPMLRLGLPVRRGLSATQRSSRLGHAGRESRRYVAASHCDRPQGGGSHAALVLDGAGCHIVAALTIPENINLVRLPSYAPELKPIENVWEYLRDDKLAFTVFDDYNDIVDNA